MPVRANFKGGETSLKGGNTTDSLAKIDSFGYTGYSQAERRLHP